MYKEAALKGQIRAFYLYAVILEEGRGGSVNYKEAFNWYLKAANKGIKDANYKVGFFLESGLLGYKDVLAAKEWYLAASRNHNEARQALLRIYAAEAVANKQLEKERLQKLKRKEKEEARLAAIRQKEIDKQNKIARLKAVERRLKLQRADALKQEKENAIKRVALVRSKIKEVQYLLAYLGYDVGKISGEWGAETKAALKLLLKKAGNNSSIEPNLRSLNNVLKVARNQLPKPNHQ